MKPKIIAFTGLQGAGKSTAAAITANLLKLSNYEPHVIKFADPIYDVMHSMCGILNCPFDKPKHRPIMQFIGTYFRENYKEDFWVDSWESRLKSLYSNNQNQDKVVIIADDLRFDNEAQKVKSLGGKIIKVETAAEIRSGRIDIVGAEHTSENGVDQSFVDASVFNNKAVSDLNSNLKYILTVFNLL